jgi:hypothetical protein
MTTQYLRDVVPSMLPPRPKLYEVMDVENRGLGVRVNPGGKKSWFYRYKKDSKVTVIGLGDVGSVHYDYAVAYYQQLKLDKNSRIIDSPSYNDEAKYLILVLRNHFYRTGDFPKFLLQGVSLSALSIVYHVSVESVVLLLERGYFSPSLSHEHLKVVASEDALMSSRPYSTYWL